MQHPTAFLTLRPHAEGRPEDAALELFPLEERILVALAQQPWASAADFAQRLDMSESDIHKACHELEENKHVAGREMGVTRRMQRRYVLSRQGVLHVTRPFQHKGLIRAPHPDAGGHNPRPDGTIFPMATRSTVCKFRFVRQSLSRRVFERLRKAGRLTLWTLHKNAPFMERLMQWWA